LLNSTCRIIRPAMLHGESFDDNSQYYKWGYTKFDWIFNDLPCAVLLKIAFVKLLFKML
jgi:hypothetical protein